MSPVATKTSSPEPFTCRHDIPGIAVDSLKSGWIVKLSAAVLETFWETCTYMERTNPLVAV
jgi:hypothetical protein